MVQRGEQFGLALKPRQTLGVACKRVRQDFDRHVALQSRVARAVDLAHPSGADEGEDLVNAEANAGREAHL